MSRILYSDEPSLDVAEFKRVLAASGLGAIRPLDDAPRLSAMLANSDLILTARLEESGRPLVGIARCVTDFTWCCYLSELAVVASVQGRGVGKGLLLEVRKRLGPSVSLILLSVPEATGFYERVEMKRAPDAFQFKREY